VTAGLRVVAQYDILLEKRKYGYCKVFDHAGVVDISEDFEEIVYTSNISLLEEICSSLLEKVTTEKSIAIPLFHLYRQESVLYEYLKGPDLALYDALSETFDIELAAVIITNDSGEDGNWCDYSIHPSESSPVSCDRNVTFIVSGHEQLVLIESQTYTEHTGNESQDGFQQYFTGAMVLSAKGTVVKRKFSDV